ncbi:MAG: maltose alpha-D-glucosyltransferase [Deltaproteobacteria bacterium]|nr:maltose alpha-D-glucosyltransferase [Deltaproteobacteria bacterium]
MTLEDPKPEQPRATEPATTLVGNPTWFKDALIYELHVRAFHDSNADGVGDLPGLISKLDYLRDLGVTALWLLPFYPSPLRDGGYDIADYYGVHPAYGTIADVSRLLEEAHRRGLRVITELVLNHTSADHAWFQRARRAPPGSPERDFYVWSDTPEKYTEARIIFTDFESSNWSWDPVAKAYFWHRFYAHQPDLNFDNPEVRREMLRVVDFWLELGVDGLRLDAVPYLFERPGTSCENLPETHAFLRELRSHVDAKFSDRMLLAEANQWPSDAAAYFGAGDECHMNFHFPLMPRMFMAVQLEDSFPIVDILAQTPAIPDNCQWATFLRNHDELTLEMVTDEERDFMVRVFADDPNARINLGIRRRLAPLLRGRRKVELVNALLFSLPGTPVLYYGDEIGMGDNIYLGDRDGVRTPMQWSPDRNAGFSEATSQRLYLPLIIDSEYHHQAINVQAQQDNPSSLLWWMKRLIAIRKQHRVFGRGSVEFLSASNDKVIAFVRSFEDERVMVVANLSRFPQHVMLQTAGLAGHVPVELFGRTRFPPIRNGEYTLSFGPHGFYWFLLEPEQASAVAQRERLAVLELATDVANLVRSEAAQLGRALERYLAERRWFRSKARLRKDVTVDACFALPGAPDDGHLALARVQYIDHEPERYLVGLAVCEGEAAVALEQRQPHTLIARTLRPGGEPGVLYDALSVARTGAALRMALRSAQPIQGDGAAGQLMSTTMPGMADLLEPELAITAPTLEQSNSTFIYGDRALLKVYRLIEEGEGVEVEMGRYLATHLEQPIAPRLGAALELRAPGRPPATLAALQQFVPNQGDAWHLALDWLGRCFERGLTSERQGVATFEPPAGGWLHRATQSIPEAQHVLLGGFPGHMRVLGRRTAELHLALLRGTSAAFRPEPFTTMHAQSVYQRARAMLVRTCDLLGARLDSFGADQRALVEQLIGLEAQLSRRLSRVTTARIDCARIRHHGDLHLGQVLKTGDDFVIIDFEGEPARQLHERRYKRGALRDVAGMMRSFQYAAASALRAPGVRPEDQPTLRRVARLCEVWASTSYLAAYLESARGTRLVPATEPELELLIEFYLLEKAIYEIGYEANNRPDWLEVPLRSLLETFGGWEPGA